MNKKILGIIIASIVIVGAYLFYKESKAPVSTDANLETLSPTAPVAKNTNESTEETLPETITTPKPSLVAPPKTATTTVTQAQAPAPAPTPGPKTFTLAQVAMHTSETDCYSAINGKVYNLSAWIEKHPGGDRAILSICGKDGSGAFNNQHGGQNKPERILEGFQIGVLVM